MSVQLDREQRGRSGYERASARVTPAPSPGTPAPTRAAASVFPRGAAMRRPRTVARRRPAAAPLTVRPAVGQVGCGPTRDAGYRLGRWARLSLTVAVVVSALLIGTGVVSLGGTSTGPAATAEVSVLPGDTLWSIAGRAAPNADTAAVVERIRELNELPSTASAVLPVGMVLLVPTG